MRILYLAPRYDYGKPEQGASFEHANFWDCLRHMGVDILHFDYMALLQTYGRDGMNQRLWEVAQAEQPDLLFACLLEEQIERDTMRRISEETGTVTFNWFCDDHWRFENFSQHWARCFHWVSTTAGSALPKYAAIGYANVIKTQWACNPFSYRPLGLPLRYDITFVGQPHGDRLAMVARLRAAGLSVQAWGRGWETGRIGQDEMIRVFNQSRINLNLTNSQRLPATGDGPDSLTPNGTAPVAKARARALASALPVPVMQIGRRVLSAVRPAVPPSPALPSPALQKPPAAPLVEQIKGRNFEVPGCGGFLLTGMADNLEDYYAPGQEIACFASPDEMVAQARYFLAHEEKRVAIAEAGLARTRREHTYVHRFSEIFTRMGLPCLPVETILAGAAPPGAQEEVS